MRSLTRVLTTCHAEVRLIPFDRILVSHIVVSITLSAVSAARV